jgi:hypothetical protein
MAPMSAGSAVFHPRVRVIDHDPRQWANLYDLLMPAAPGTRTVFLLHDKGKVLKSWPGCMREGIPERVADPAAAARLLSERMRARVCVIELAVWKEWLDGLQRGFAPSDDILSLLLKAKDGLMEKGGYGIVIHPDPFAGIAGVRPDSPARLMRRLVPPAGRSSLVAAVLDAAGVHASLCMEIVDATVRTITTCPDDASRASDSLTVRGARMMRFAAERFCPPALGLFCDRQAAGRLKREGWKPEAIARELAAGSLVCLPDKDPILPLLKEKSPR